MKLNNYGFGFRETILYLSVLFLLLLFTSCSISSFYKDLENDKGTGYSYQDGYLFDVEDKKNNNVNNNTNTVDDSLPSYDQNEDSNVQVIQMSHYYSAEQRLYNAAMNYAVDNNIPPSEYLYTVRLEDLVNLKYMDSNVVDYVDGSVCTGYSNIMSDSDGYQVEAYIYCKNYKTEGYK